MPENSSSSSGIPEYNSSSSTICLGSSSSAGGGTSPGGDGGSALRENKAILTLLSKNQGILLVAQITEYVAPLQARRILPVDVAAQLAEIAAVRPLASGSGKVSRLGSTQAEIAAAHAFLLYYDEFTTAAKQEYSRSNKLHLRLYHYGENHRISRAILEQFGQDVIDNAAVDDLPGITPEKIAAARLALKAYIDSNVEQGKTTKNAATGTVTLEQRVKAITAYVVKVQLAADAEWPHTNPANIPIRRQFKLPVRMKLKG